MFEVSHFGQHEEASRVGQPLVVTLSPSSDRRLLRSNVSVRLGVGQGGLYYELMYAVVWLCCVACHAVFRFSLLPLVCLMVTWCVA